MHDQKYDVGIIGGLCSFDLVLAEQLARGGIRSSVAVTQGELGRRSVLPGEGFLARWQIDDVAECKGPLEVARWARRSRLLVSITGALAFALREFWFARHILNLPPVVNFTTGSDIMELAVAKSRSAFVYRQYLRFAALNWCVPYPEALRNIVHLRVPRVVFLPFPYELPQPAAPALARGSDRRGPIRFFHPSHLDWGVVDSAPGRMSTKGNDRFIRAFARAAREAGNLECTILDRGSDRETAKRLIAQLGAEQFFRWQAPVSRTELIPLYLEADIVVDQFDVGGLGGIAIEAMSLSRPVLMYVDQESARVQYDEPPPVLNCRTEQQIHEMILQCRNRDLLSARGSAARRWVEQHHDAQTFATRFRLYYSVLTGRSAASPLPDR